MSIPVNLPGRITSGDPVTANWANSIRESLARLARRKPPLPGGGGRGKDTVPPLWPSLVIGGTPEAPTYKVKLTPGFVNERIPGDAEALAVNEIQNIASELDITIGQQVSVVVYVDEDGILGGPDAPSPYVAELVIEAEDTASSHYIPPVGDESAGTPGEYHYKIAVFKDADVDHAAPWLDKFLAGSHISHFVDLPRFKKQAGTYDIFKTYDGSTRKYKTKGLTTAEDDYTLTQSIEIDDTTDELKFKTKGANLNLTIQYFSESSIDAFIYHDGSDVILYWRDGLFVGLDDPGGSPPDLIEKNIAEFHGIS